MTNQDGIIKSLETLIKHEKTIQTHGSDIDTIMELVGKALHTTEQHEFKLNLLCGMVTTLSHEVLQLRNNKTTFGVN